METFEEFEIQVNRELAKCLGLIKPGFSQNPKNAVKVASEFFQKMKELDHWYTTLFPDEASPNKIDVLTRIAFVKFLEKSRRY